jgi:hypothetical protein
MISGISKSDLQIFYAFCLSVIALFFVGLKLDIPYLALIPFALLMMVWGVSNYKSLFILLMAMLPISVEYYFSSSLATDIPTEPLMIVQLHYCCFFLKLIYFRLKLFVPFRFFFYYCTCFGY